MTAGIVTGTAIVAGDGRRMTSSACRSTGFDLGGGAGGAGGTSRMTRGFSAISSTALRHGANDRIATSAVANIAAVISSETPKLGHRGSGVVRSNHRGPFVTSIGAYPQPPRLPRYRAVKSVFPLIPRHASASSVDVLSTSSRLTSSFGECMYRFGMDT